MKVDLELGGSDQMFNMLCGRTLVKEMQGREKFVMTTPLLTDSSGNKIGKTEGNVIALTLAPSEFYAMIMSLPDDIIVKAFEFITNIPMEEVSIMKKALEKGDNPMDYKKKLAFTLTEMLNSTNDAKVAQSSFQKTVQNKETPDNIPELYSGEKSVDLVELLASNNLVSSKSQARRLIGQGGVEWDGEKVTDFTLKQKAKDGIILKVGKRNYYRIKIK